MVSFEHASEGERRQRQAELQPLPCPALSLPPRWMLPASPPWGPSLGRRAPRYVALILGGWGACLGLGRVFGVRWPQGGGRGGCARETLGCRAGC